MRAGERLKDRYTILRNIKSGGMGAVYLAEDGNLAKSLCAVKQMHDLGGAVDDYMRSRFESEMMALVQLKHPGIPRVRDYFQEGLSCFLVMDFVEGHSLEEELQHHRESKTTCLPQAAVADMLTVLDVLAYMHRQTPPVLHRDIKPANLIRDKISGQIKVVDFGLARSVETHTSAVHTSVGTLGYSAVEQLSGQPEPRSDLYSVGATLYEMLSGLRPSLAGVPLLTYANMPHYDRDLAGIVAHSTALEVGQRYASSAEMSRALQHWLISQNSELTFPTDTVEVEASPPPRRRSPWVVAFVALLAVLLLALPFTGITWPSLSGDQDPGLQGDIFASQQVGSDYQVSLGEDVGLFWIREVDPGISKIRCKTVADRLNRLYHDQCPGCKQFLLEPGGIRVGRLRRGPVDEVVLFYAHMHGDTYIYGPELLATVDRRLAARVSTTPRYLAGYWRELMRDVVALSRGESSSASPLGPAFRSAMESLRHKPKQASASQLRAILGQLPSAEAQRLQRAFQSVPAEFHFNSDRFPKQAGYSPLKG